MAFVAAPLDGASDLRDLIDEYNKSELGLRDLKPSVGITSIVQLGMITIIAYVGELLLENGVLQTVAIILVQVSCLGRLPGVLIWTP